MPDSGLLTSLMAYWKLDEASGTRSDSYGANHLTDVNTVTQAAGKLSYAAQFTAVNAERLTIADNAALSMGDIDFTLCCWVYFDTLPVSGLIAKWNGTADEYAIYYDGGGRIRFGVDGGGGLVTVPADALGTPSTSTWYFIVAWHDSVANTINIQVNNGTINTAAHSVGVNNSDGIFRLGEISLVYLNGRMDGVGVWKRVLTQSERQYLYNTGSGNDYPFPMEWRGPHRDTPPLSMRDDIQIWLFNALGYRVQLIPSYVSVKYNRSIRGGGGIELELPPNFDTRYLRDLSYLVVEEKIGGRSMQYRETFVIQSIPQSVTARGTRFLTLEGPTATDFFVGKGSRIVAALEGGTGGSYTDSTDDLARKFVSDALAYGAGNSGTAEGRDLSVYAGFSVEPERGLGPSITVGGFTRALDEVLSEIRSKSEQNSAAPLRLFYTVRPKSFAPLRFEFVVLARYFGKYRGFTAASPIILSPALANVAQVEVEHDYREAYNSVWITYSAKASSTRVTSTTRRNIAPQGFREVYFDAANSASETDAQSEAQGKLAEGKERKLARVTAAHSPVLRFGAEYDLGDVVGTLFLGRRAEMEVTSEEVQRDSSGLQRALKLDEV